MDKKSFIIDLSHDFYGFNIGLSFYFRSNTVLIHCFLSLSLSIFFHTLKRKE